MRDKTILVIGGTGHQGGASARHLLAEGFPVRAIVRDTLKPAARALAEVGAELIEGDLDDPRVVRPGHGRRVWGAQRAGIYAG